MSITEKLLKLYRVDQQVRGLRTRVESAEIYAKAQRRKCDELAALREQMEGQARQLTAHAGNVETEINAEEDRIAELRERMNQAQTNKEYTALLTEINTLKVDKDKKESGALEEMGKVDEVKEQIADLDTQIAERQKILKGAEKELVERRSEVGERLAELEAERAEAAADIPPGVLQNFDEQAHCYDGEAMAEIEELDRRNHEYLCGACNMTIPVERLSALLGRGELTSCPSCNRLLYLAEDLRESLSATNAAKAKSRR